MADDNRLEIRGNFNTGRDAVERLQQAMEGTIPTLVFTMLEFDHDNVSATLDLRHHYARQGHVLKKLQFWLCLGINISKIIEAATDLKSCSEIYVSAFADYQVLVAISEGMKNNTNLETVSLRWVSFDDVLSTACLSDGLKNCHSNFTRLSLLNCELEGDEAFTAFAAGLEKNSSLETLELMACNLIDSHVIRIIETCPARLRICNLRNNAITNRGLEIIAQRSTLDNALRKLALDGNNFTVAATRGHILRILQHNPHLGYLVNSSDPDIQHLQDLNLSGRVILSQVGSNSVAPSLWPLVLERANSLFQDDEGRRANVLFHLVKARD